MDKKRVLIVEDATTLARAVMTKLTDLGFVVEHVDDGKAALEMLSKNEFDLILLDLNIPKLDGFDVANAVKELGYSVRIIAVTARDSINDKLKGFDLGFDDYVVKPFDMRELIARINAVLRNGMVKDDQCYQVAGLRVNIGTRIINKDNEMEIKLTKLEFDLLHLLLDRSPAVVTNDEIIEQLWGDDDNWDPPVRSHIKNLRKKLGDNDFTIIKTVPGVGYKIDNAIECQDR